jgi:hypothetical protein
MRTIAEVLRISTVSCLAPLLAGTFVSRVDAADVRVDAIVVKPASPGPSALCESQGALEKHWEPKRLLFQIQREDQRPG